MREEEKEDVAGPAVVPLWYLPMCLTCPDLPEPWKLSDDLDAPGGIGQLCRSAGGRAVVGSNPTAPIPEAGAAGCTPPNNFLEFPAVRGWEVTDNRGRVRNGPADPCLCSAGGSLFGHLGAGLGQERERRRRLRRLHGGGELRSGPDRIGLGGEMSAVTFKTGAATDAAAATSTSPTALNNRIQKFDASDGNWVAAWGKNVNGGGVFGVCTVAANCLAGTTPACLGGEMNVPGRSTARDWESRPIPRGHVYVADGVNNRIQKFESDVGIWLAAWGKNVNWKQRGVFGDLHGGGRSPVGSKSAAASVAKMNSAPGAAWEVATDAAGNVYLLGEVQASRIQKFESGWRLAGRLGQGRERRRSLRSLHGCRQLPAGTIRRTRRRDVGWRCTRARSRQ